VTKCEILRARCENPLKASRPQDVVRAQQRLDQSEQKLAELMIMPFDDAAAAQLPLSPKELEAIRVSVQRGRPCGDQGWTEEVAKRSG
jgi:hypothetical protein